MSRIAHETPPTERRYALKSKATGRFLRDGGERNDHHVQVVRTDFGAEATWVLEGSDHGHRLRNVKSDRTMDSNAERQVYTLPSNDGSYQKWEMHPDGEGYWSLVNVATGLALDASPDDVYTLAPNDGAYQRWRFEPR